jgi:hypothetical protein
MSDFEPTYTEVVLSLEQQYRLILNEAAAYSYARSEIIAQRERAVLEPPPMPYREWYRDYLHSPEWKAKVAAAKARFGDRCALCNADVALEAHHRTYERVGEEAPDDLTALCAD